MPRDTGVGHKKKLLHYRATHAAAQGWAPRKALKEMANENANVLHLQPAKADPTNIPDGQDMSTNFGYEKYY